MSTFQKLLNRFLGQVDGSYNPNINSSNPTLSTLQRSQSLTKVINSRRQRSFELLKSASCLSCGISEQDRQLSFDNLNTLVPITSKNEYNFDLVDHNNENTIFQQQQQIRQKRRAKTKLIIIRHGERVDALFGENWFSQAFDQTGKYHRFHTNLPMTLPYRQNFQDYLHDPPLTELGLIRSYRTGEALYRTGLRIDYCYSSPSLRCIQTADAILDGMKLRTLIPIRIELGLFECGLWHKNVIPHFMSINELILNRLNIETSYNSIQKSLSTDENEYDYYERSYLVMRQILTKHDTNDMTILFIGHAPSLETLTRQLIGAQPRPNELVDIAQKINYLSLTILEGQKHSWTFVDAILAK
jgi:broad specificity phosphatase PhoE